MILTSAQSFVIGFVGFGLFVWAIFCNLTCRTGEKIFFENIIGFLGLLIMVWLFFSPEICSNIIQVKRV